MNRQDLFHLLNPLTFDRMKRLPFKRSDLWIALGFLFCYLAIFDEKLDLGGDNAVYYILGKALHSGQGYTDIHLPGATPANHFPPGYPAILSLFMTISESFVFLKWMNGLLFLGSLLLLQRLFVRMTGNATISWIALALSLLNVHLLRSATILMSEIPFLFFSALTLTCLVHWRESEKVPFWKSPWFWGMLVSSVVAYHIRSAGLALIGGIGLYLLFQRKWWTAVGYGAGFIGFSLPWFLRGKALGGTPYLEQLIQVNPYRPEEGILNSFSGWLARIQENGWRYLTQEIPNGMFPNLEVVYSKEEPQGYLLYGLILLSLILIGTLKMPKLRMMWIGYLGASAVLFLVWPEVWFGVRFMQPLLPFLLLAATMGAMEVLKGIQGALKLPSMIRSPYWLILAAMIQLPALKAMREESQETIKPQYVNYFSVAKYANENLPPEAVVATSKPGLFYLYAERPCLRIPSLEDHEAFLERLREQGVTHVVVDQLGYSAISRYLVPVIQHYPDRFPLILQLPSPDTYLLEVQFTEQPNAAP
jgi:hypothetical protein